MKTQKPKEENYSRLFVNEKGELVEFVEFTSGVTSYAFNGLKENIESYVISLGRVE